jgi:hypothetical protein
VIPIANARSRPTADRSRQSTVDPRPAAARTEPRDRDCLKFFPPHEARQRRIVAWVAGGVSILFLGLALAGVLTHRSLVLLPYGSDLLIEAAMAVWPGFWPLSVIHNAMVAGVAALFLVAVTTGHTGLPGDPRRSEMVVWRRTVRFAYPDIALSVLLFCAGMCLQYHAHPLLAALFESPASVMVLRGCAHVFVPITRMFVLVELDRLNGGVSNRITIGGGRRGVRQGMIVIWHGRLIDARKRSSFFEWCFGLASLDVTYIDTAGRPAQIRVPALASAVVVQRIEEILKGEFRVALSEKSLDIPAKHPLRGTDQPVAPNRPTSTL